MATKRLPAKIRNNNVTKKSSKSEVSPADPTNSSRVSVGVWQGPLPPPAVLDAYEINTPGAKERIIRMAEKEQDHRHSTEKTTVDAQALSVKLTAFSDFFARLFGQLFLLMTFLTSLYFAFYRGDAKLAALFFSPFVIVALVELISGRWRKK